MSDSAGRSLVGLLITVAVVASLVQVGGAGIDGIGGDPTEQSDDFPEPALQSAAPAENYDGLGVQIRVHSNGTASWEVDFRYELADDAAQEAFEQVRRNVTNPPGEFVTLMQESAVATAEETTGRSMELRNGVVRTNRSVPAGRFGVVSYRFQWTNFAAQPADDRLEVGDALGEFRLDRNSTLTVEWSDGLARQSVTPEPDASRERLVGWEGPLQFRTVGPTIELTVTGAGGGLPLVPVGMLAVVLLVGGAVGLAILWKWREEEGATGPAPGGGQTAPNDELLSDEERVLQLLDANGGRMKQQDLIDKVDWSRTKASDVVNEMHEAEQIEVFRLGRENVLTLPGEIEV